MVLLSIQRNDTILTQCDELCYNPNHPGHKKQCHCICEGKNHGTGLDYSLENIRNHGVEMISKWYLSDYIASGQLAIFFYPESIPDSDTIFVCHDIKQMGFSFLDKYNEWWELL